MKLHEKVELATKDAATPEAAAAELKASMSKEDCSAAWSRHNCWLKHQPANVVAEHQELSKAEKGHAVAVWLVKSQAKKFQGWSQTRSGETSLDKRERWVSEQKILQDHSWEEFQMHLSSGRIAWREDPMTPGIYNYADRGDITRNTKVAESTVYTRGQEYEAQGPEDDEEWAKVQNRDLHSSLQEWEFKGKGKLALPKGQGKGGKGGKGWKGKGKSDTLAIEDGDPKGEEQKEPDLNKCLSKAKTMRNQLGGSVQDLEGSLKLALKTKRLTATSKKESQDVVGEAQAMQASLQHFLLKQKLSVGEAKDLLKQAATVLKKAKDENKELQQVLHKAGSKASSK